jgi:hypothetical protein
MMFFIGVQGENIVSLAPLPQAMSKDDALELAASLVSVTDMCWNEPDSEFAKKMKEKGL